MLMIKMSPSMVRFSCSLKILVSILIASVEQ